MKTAGLSFRPIINFHLDLDPILINLPPHGSRGARLFARLPAWPSLEVGKTSCCRRHQPYSERVAICLHLIRLQQPLRGLRK